MSTAVASAHEIEADTKDAVEKATKPGIYTAQEIPAYFYHRMQAVASHQLQGFYKTPAHARERILHPFDPTPEQDFGAALHTRVLEPHLFDLQYLVAPKVDKRTKAGKETWADFEKQAAGRTLLTAGDRDRVEDIARSVERHPAAREILAAPGANELTVIWEQPVEDDDGTVTRELCRARLDILRTLADDTWVWDLKTTQDASERGFERQVGLYHYNLQLGFYLMGLDAHAPAPRRAGFIAVEKERPYAVNVLELDGMDLEQGAREAKAHLRTLVRCRRTGIWPAFGDGVGYVGLPKWAKEE